MKNGLVLEGGAMRGMFTCGVTDVLLEKGVVFDGAIGVSAGAVFGCNYKSKQPGRAIRYNLRFCNDPHYASFRSLLTTGDLYGERFCYHDIPDTLDPFDRETYQKNPMEFFVVCTDVETGRPIYYQSTTGNDKELQWFRASASMPLVSRIVSVDGHRMLDGGMSDSIPVRVFEKLGYHHNVVVLTQPKGFVKQRNAYLPLMKARYARYPKLINAIALRHHHYNNTTAYLEEQEKQGKTLVIRPPYALEVGSVEHDSNKLLAAYHLGRQVAEERLAEILSFVGQEELAKP